MRAVPFLAVALLLAGCFAAPGDDGDPATVPSSSTTATQPASNSTSSNSTSTTAAASSSASTSAAPRPGTAFQVPWTPLACDPEQPTTRTVNAWPLPGLREPFPDAAARVAALFNDTLDGTSYLTIYNLTSDGSVQLSDARLEAHGHTDWIGADGAAGLPGVERFLDGLWADWRGNVTLVHEADREYEKPAGGYEPRIHQDYYALRQALNVTLEGKDGQPADLSDPTFASGSILRHVEGDRPLHITKLHDLRVYAPLTDALPVAELEARAEGFARCHLDATRGAGNYTLKEAQWHGYAEVYGGGGNGTVAALVNHPYSVPGQQPGCNRLVGVRIDLVGGAILSKHEGATQCTLA